MHVLSMFKAVFRFMHANEGLLAGSTNACRIHQAALFMGYPLARADASGSCLRCDASSARKKNIILLCQTPVVLSLGARIRASISFQMISISV